MYLLFNNYKKIIINFFVVILLLIFQIYFPSIVTSEDFLLIKFDFILIYLVYLSFNYRIYLTICFAFFMGIFQDLLVQPSTIGLFSFLKVLFVYFIGYLKDSNNIWSLQFKYLFLLFLLFTHNFLYHYIFINEFNFYALVYILLESLMNLILIILIDRLIFTKKVF